MSTDLRIRRFEGTAAVEKAGVSKRASGEGVRVVAGLANTVIAFMVLGLQG
jgi:hypothetical protein